MRTGARAPRQRAPPGGRPRRRQAVDEPPSVRGEPHVHLAAVVRGDGPGEQAVAFRSGRPFGRRRCRGDRLAGEPAGTRSAVGAAVGLPRTAQAVLWEAAAAAGAVAGCRCGRWPVGWGTAPCSARPAPRSARPRPCAAWTSPPGGERRGGGALPGRGGPGHHGQLRVRGRVRHPAGPGGPPPAEPERPRRPLRGGGGDPARRAWPGRRQHRGGRPRGRCATACGTGGAGPRRRNCAVSAPGPRALPPARARLSRAVLSPRETSSVAGGEPWTGGTSPPSRPRPPSRPPAGCSRPPRSPADAVAGPGPARSVPGAA